MADGNGVYTTKVDLPVGCYTSAKKWNVAGAPIPRKVEQPRPAGMKTEKA